MTIRRSIRVAAVALAAAICTLPALAQKRVALVIGNAAYKEQPLRNPVNDARAMAAALRESGFEVTVKENLAKAGLEQAIAEWGERLKAGDTAVFYYAGHGVQVRGQNYLQPVDARLTNENRVRIEAVPADLVLEQMAAAGVKVSVVVLDACRDNPFERRFRSSAAAGGLAQLTAPEGTLIAYATAPGKLALDGDGRNSIYTTALVRALRQPGLNVEDVFKQVRVEVSRATQGQQVPWESSSLTGDFVFRPGAPAAAPQTAALPPPAAPAPRVTDPQEAERVFFESASNSRSLAMLNAYLERYPQGRYVFQARSILGSLRVAALPDAPSASSPLVPKRFDGHYKGIFGCEASLGATAYSRRFSITIARHAGRYEADAEGPGGRQQGELSLDDDGRATFSGDHYQDGRFVGFAMVGAADGDKLVLMSAVGAERRCAVEAIRQFENDIDFLNWLKDREKDAKDVAASAAAPSSTAGPTSESIATGGPTPAPRVEGESHKVAARRPDDHDGRYSGTLRCPRERRQSLEIRDGVIRMEWGSPNDISYRRFEGPVGGNGNVALNSIAESDWGKTVAILRGRVAGGEIKLTGSGGVGGQGCSLVATRIAD